MGTRTVFVHVGHGYVPIRLALLYHLEHFLWTRNETFGRALHERHPVLVFVYA